MDYTLHPGTRTERRTVKKISYTIGLKEERSRVFIELFTGRRLEGQYVTHFNLTNATALACDTSTLKGARACRRRASGTVYHLVK